MSILSFYFFFFFAEISEEGVFLQLDIDVLAVSTILLIFFAFCFMAVPSVLHGNARQIWRGKAKNGGSHRKSVEKVVVPPRQIEPEASKVQIEPAIAVVGLYRVAYGLPTYAYVHRL
jgi:hypothetical protein